MVCFDFSKDLVLENERVRLSPLKLEHISALASVANEPEVWTHFLENGCGENLEGYVRQALECRRDEKEYAFVVFDKSRHAIAGMTRLYNIDMHTRNLKMGHTWYGKNFWGTRLNQNCKYLLFEFIFEALEMERIGFGVSAENIRSIKALKRLGCQREGILRSFLPGLENEERINLELFGLLKSEWLNGVKEELYSRLVNEFQIE